MSDCAFCKIIGREEEAHIVYEDEYCLAFLDNRPLFHGHVLLVPKKHFVTIMTAENAMLNHLIKITKQLSLGVRQATRSEGIFIANNNIVSQSVPHFHIHIVPRNEGDGLRGFFWPRNPYENEEQMKRVADELRNAIAEL